MGGIGYRILSQGKSYAAPTGFYRNLGLEKNSGPGSGPGPTRSSELVHGSAWRSKSGGVTTPRLHSDQCYCFCMEPATSPYHLLRLNQVTKMLGLSKSTIYNKIANGTFPKPINLGGQSVAWIESEINAWVEDRIAASRSCAP
jgi:prophage regulatory protein